MADAFIGEIRIFAGNYAPRGWEICNGQTMQIIEYSALYGVISNKYGGDGKTTFHLPDLRGRAPMNQGIGEGLTSRNVGDEAGMVSVTLNTSQMPNHTHIPMAVNSAGSSGNPINQIWSTSIATGRPPTPKYNLYNEVSNDTNIVNLSPLALDITGGNQPHNNMQPYLTLNFIICTTDGLFPVKTD